ncbi:MAG: hypothetical protein ACFE8F_03180 [Promethearchaeota archaeon]
MTSLVPPQLEDSFMPQPDTEEGQTPATFKNYPGKVGRRDLSIWTKVCPGCFSPNIEPLTNISGFIVHEQWICKKCDYSGVSIEVKTEDLIQFRLQQQRQQFNRNKKTFSTK